MTTVDTFAAAFNRWPTSYRNWCPIISVPALPYSKFYNIEDSARPGFSKDGTGAAKIAIAKTESTANMAWIHYDIEISYMDMEAARESNTPLLEQIIAEGLTKMDLEIERVIFQGLSTDEGSVAINGFFDSGTNIASADAWDTAPNPVEHVVDAVASLNSYGYKEPFDWVCSLSLKPGLQKLHNAASDLSVANLIKQNYDIGNIYYQTHGTSTDLICYPLPLDTAQEGVWTMFQGNNKDNFRLAEAFRPWVRFDQNLNTRDNMFYGRIDWMGTIQIPRPKSITKHINVTLT